MMNTRYLSQLKKRIVTASAVLGVFFLLPFSAYAGTQNLSMTAKQSGFSPSTITVTEGDVVNLSITSVDVDHGFSLPEFGVEATLKKGTTTTVNFTASKAGSYTFSCSVYCGSEHSEMTGTLVVEAAEQTTSTPSDSQAPSISGVSVGETTSGTATVEWTTNEAAKGQVEYGTTAGVYTAATAVESKLTTSHSALLSGLSAGTTYYFRVKSTDESGNLARSSESSLKTEDSDSKNDNDNENENDNDNDNSNDNENENTNDDNDNENDNDNSNENENDNDNSSTDEDFAVTSIKTDSGTFDTTDAITATVGEEMTIKGTGTPGATVIVEFCCATTQYTVIVNEGGNWVFQGAPQLEAGTDNSLTVYEKGKQSDAQSMDLKLVQKGDENAANANQSGSDSEKKGGFSTVAIVIIVGLILVVFAGVMFVRQMRR